MLVLSVYRIEEIILVLTFISGYVRQYYDVKNRAFLQNFMRDFCHFYAHFLLFNHSKYIKCENRASSMENMRDFLI